MSKRLAGTFSGLGYWPAASCLEFHLRDLLETEIFRADNAQRTSFDGSKANEPSTIPLVAHPKRRMAKNCTTVPLLIPEKLIHDTTNENARGVMGSNKTNSPCYQKSHPWRINGMSDRPLPPERLLIEVGALKVVSICFGLYINLFDDVYLCWGWLIADEYFSCVKFID